MNSKFYDELSDDYHLIFDNWEAAIRDQGLILKSIIEKYGKIESNTVLDCACGIGTQAIGLASLGYVVFGTDLSPKAIERAKVEAENQGLFISFKVADFRTLDTDVRGNFDVVIACDNALPHLLETDDMLLAAKNILNRMDHGGLFIGSIRDYDEILKEKPRSTVPLVKDSQDQRTISFQVWDWVDEDIYAVNHFTLKSRGEDFDTLLRKTIYRAYRRTDLTKIFEQVGFTEIEWLMPEQCGYYQPILIAKKA